MHDCDLGAVEDALVWTYARENGFTIVTKDSDFEQRAVLFGAPPKIIWLRTGNCATEHLVALLAAHTPQIEEFDTSPGDVVLELA